MAERRIEHTFDCSVDTFWSGVFFDDAYNQALFHQHLGFQRWEIVERENHEDGFTRVIEAEPPTPDPPGPLKALMKRGAGYRERGIFKRSESRYSVQVTPKSLPDKLLISGEMSVTARGEGRCHRVYIARVTAKVFGVGAMLEKRILDDIEASYEKSAEFTREWLRQSGLSGQ